MKNLDTFDRYLNKEMNDREISSFESKLASEEEFAKQYQEYLHTVNQIKTIHFRDDIHKAISNVRSRNKFIYMAIAACIALVIASFAIFIQSNENPHDLYSKYYSPYPSREALRGVEDLNTKAFEAYENQDFIVALDYFDQIENPSDKINFYKAQCLLSLGKSDEAIKVLRIVSPESIYSDQSHWYLALAYLKNQRLNDSKESLSQIKESSSRKPVADELLEQLD